MEKFFIAIIIVIIAGALYAAVNVSPNKYENREPLLNSFFWAMLSILSCMVAGAAVMGSFYQSTWKGIVAIIFLVIGFCLTRYVIKKPERKYINEQQN